MPLIHYACTNCGHWQPWFAGQSPTGCPICSDVRNALPEDGWDFADEARVARALTTTWREYLPDLWGYSCTPKFGLGATGWLLVRPDGNVAFEGAPHYTPEALDHIASIGGVRVLAASHPHGYGALWQLQRRFDPVVTVHRDDVRYTKAFRVTWPADDTHELAPGLTMHHVGGHYEGQSVLYDSDRRALFCGDSLKFDDFDDQGEVHALSCHKGYHYQIPLSRDELRKYRSVYENLPFERAFTPFEFAPNVGQADALALFDRLLAGTPTTRSFAMEQP